MAQVRQDCTHTRGCPGPLLHPRGESRLGRPGGRGWLLRHKPAVSRKTTATWRDHGESVSILSTSLSDQVLKSFMCQKSAATSTAPAKIHRTRVRATALTAHLPDKCFRTCSVALRLHYSLWHHAALTPDARGHVFTNPSEASAAYPEMPPLTKTPLFTVATFTKCWRSTRVWGSGREPSPNVTLLCSSPRMATSAGGAGLQ